MRLVAGLGDDRSNAMGADYIPKADGRAVVWMKWFARALVNNPAAYRTTIEDAEEIQAAALGFEEAYRISAPEGSRCMAFVRTKNNARGAAERLIRPASQRIKTDPHISTELKLRIGLAPRRKPRRDVPAVESVPQLQLRNNASGAIQIKVTDSQSNRSARPRDAKGLELYERVRPRQVVDAKADTAEGAIPIESGSFRFIGMYPRGPITIEPSTSNPGDEVSYMARWITGLGKTGPFGRPVATRIQFRIVRNMGRGISGARRAVA